MEAMDGLDERNPIRIPAEARMEPEVMMVGNASLRDSTTASLWGMDWRSSV